MELEKKFTKLEKTNRLQIEEEPINIRVRKSETLKVDGKEDEKAAQNRMETQPTQNKAHVIISDTLTELKTSTNVTTGQPLPIIGLTPKPKKAVSKSKTVIAKILQPEDD